MTARLREAAARLERLGSSLEELADVLAEHPQADHGVPESYFAREILPQLAVAEIPLAPRVAAPHRSTARVFGQRSLRAARAGALPVMLAAALSLFGLVRLQPANTLWSQELTLTSSIETGEFHCEPITLAFTGLEHPTATTTRLNYALSGGGANGPGCQDHDISNLSIGVCFNPELDPDGPVVSETHPGTGETAWEYSPKNSSTPKLIKWDSNTEDAPLGGRGPFDPDEMRFSYTMKATLQLADLVDGPAKFKAGPTETAAGTVKVPACPLPLAAGPSTFAPVEDAIPDAEAEARPEEAPLPQVPNIPIMGGDQPAEPEAPAKPKVAGPVSIGAAPEVRPAPTPTPKPVGVAIGQPR